MECALVCPVTRAFAGHPPDSRFLLLGCDPHRWVGLQPGAPGLSPLHAPVAIWPSTCLCVLSDFGLVSLGLVGWLRVGIDCSETLFLSQAKR